MPPVNVRSFQEEVIRIVKAARRDFQFINKCDEGLSDWCVEASKFLSDRLKAAGIEHDIVYGRFDGDIDTWDIDTKEAWEGISEEDQRYHSWVDVPDVGIVDITVSQYSKENPRFFIEGTTENPVYMEKKTTPGQYLYRSTRTRPIHVAAHKKGGRRPVHEVRVRGHLRGRA